MADQGKTASQVKEEGTKHEQAKQQGASVNTVDDPKKAELEDDSTEGDNTSSIGDKNVTVTNSDGAVEGDTPGTFKDAGSLEAKQ